MEGVSTREFLVEAFKNNTFSLRDVEHNLDEITRSCFRALGEYQRDKVGLRRFSYKSSDIKMEEDFRMHLVVNHDMIEAICRKGYKNSDYFGREVTIEEMRNNKEVFEKIPVVFLDGHLTFDFTVVPYKDKTDIIFNDREIREKCSEVMVMYLYLNGMVSTNINKFIIQKYSEGFPYTLFDIGEIKKDPHGKIVGAIKYNDSERYSSFFNVIDDGAKLIPQFTDYHLGLIDQQRSSTMVLFNISYLNILDRFNGSAENANGDIVPKLFVIRDGDKIYQNPIPVENVIPLKKNTNGEFVYSTECKVVLHYPNIYEIVDENPSIDNEYTIEYFHVPVKDGKQYTNKLDAFYYLMTKAYPLESFEDILNKIYLSDKTEMKYYKLFDRYFGFADEQYTYSISDFRETMLPNHFDYKIAKMWKFIRAYPEHLREYLLTQYKTGRSFFLDVENLDLTDRVRTTSYPDGGNVTFETECYMFAIRNSNEKSLNMIVYVDGKLVMPIHTFVKDGLEFIYIPTEYVTEKSYLEVERFDEFHFERNVVLTYGSDGVEFEVFSQQVNIINFAPTLQDIYFSDELTGEILDRKEFIVELKIDDEYEVLDDDIYSCLTNIRVKLGSNKYDNRRIRITIGKTASILEYEVNAAGIFSTRLVKADFNVSKDYIRVFHNGRMLPNTLWNFSESNDPMRPYISVKYFLTKGDKIVIAITPFRYKEVYFKSRITEDGTLDLTGHINKPFDVRYYDAYINGRKLTDEHVKYITPTKIRLSGVKSLANFIIYEKDRDEEYFYLDYTKQERTINDLLIEDIENLSPDDIEDVIRYIVGYTEINTNEEPIADPDSEVSQDDFDLLQFYCDELSKVKHLIPDMYQFLDADVLQYPAVYKDMVSDETSEKPNTMRLNPDFNPSARIVLRVGSPELKKERNDKRWQM